MVFDYKLDIELIDDNGTVKRKVRKEKSKNGLFSRRMVHTFAECCEFRQIVSFGKPFVGPYSLSGSVAGL